MQDIIARALALRNNSSSIVQSDWNETDEKSMSYIQGIPCDYIPLHSNTYHDYSYTVSDNSFTMPREDFTSSEWFAVYNATTLYLYSSSNHKNIMDIIYLKGIEPTSDDSTFTVSHDRWLIFYDLGEYGTIRVDTRYGVNDTGVTVKTNGAWDYVRFDSCAKFFKTSHPFPFYDWSGQNLSPTPNSLLAVEYDTVSQCDSVCVTDSNGDVTQEYTVGVEDGTITLTPQDDYENTARYYRYADGALYYTEDVGWGEAMATEDKLSDGELDDLLVCAHVHDIIFFEGAVLNDETDNVVYRVFDAYYSVDEECYYFSVLKSDRANASCQFDVLRF